ncbi:MAG: DUF4861 domain-containing protein [Bacteroidales bacterium]|nr:DUF4861 domain-containing protein [Bacteroidales bacterium]
MKRILILVLFFPLLECAGQAKTDISLFFKRGDRHQIDSVSSKRGNLFRKLGHHGPAIENQWYALRIYFDKKSAIDVYSKAKPGLELKEKQWYPSKREQLDGWGADYYKAGNTIGLGGIRLWDGENIVPLHPVSKRTALVERTRDSSYMEMTSDGIPYMGEKVDVRVRVTVFNNTRIAKVEATSMTGTALRFVSGINYFDDLEVQVTDNYIATWGIHPEDVAAEKIAVGGAIFIPESFNLERIKLEDQYILISGQIQKITFRILSANAREPGIKSNAQFLKLVENLISE